MCKGRGLGGSSGGMRGLCRSGLLGASYSQLVLHQHFDEEAPGLPAQAQERVLLKGHIIVSDVH